MAVKTRCEQCKKLFNAPRKRYRFCSRSCRSKAFWKRTSVKMRRAWSVKAKPRTVLRCMTCKKRFEVRRTRKTTAHYCSRACAFADKRVAVPKRPRQAFVDGALKRVHIAIVEKALNRTLKQDECVHHVDSNHHNNDLNNLFVLRHGQHTTVHNIQRHRDIQLTAADILVIFPDATWLGAHH